MAHASAKNNPLKRKATKFIEAADGSEWFCALERGDCRQLMHHLGETENSHFLVQTGSRGRTVLHVAAMQGCLKLVNQVIDIYGEHGMFADGQSGVSLTLKELLQEKDGRSKATAFQLSKHVVGNREVTNCLHNVSGEIVSGRLLPVESPNSHSERIVASLTEIMDKVLGMHNFERLLRTYDADVDYNFELPVTAQPGQNLFLFHHAFKGKGLRKLQPSSERVGSSESIIKVGEKFVELVIRECINSLQADQRPMDLLQYLFKLQDARGRTPLHVATPDRNNFNIELVFELLPREEASYAECINAVDARGWTPLHWAVSHFNMNLHTHVKDERVNLNATLPGSCATPLHIAVLHGQGHRVTPLLEAKREDPRKRTNVNAIFKGCVMIRHGYHNHSSHSVWTPLQLAAVLGHADAVEHLLSKVCTHLHHLNFIFNQSCKLFECSYNVLRESLDEVGRLLQRDHTHHSLPLVCGRPTKGGLNSRA